MNLNQDVLDKLAIEINNSVAKKPELVAKYSSSG